MNMMSVSWGDHLEWGEGEGGLSTPEAIANRLDVWQRELGADAVLWRQSSAYSKLRRGFQAPNVSKRADHGNHHPENLDEGRWITEAAHKRGMKAYLYMAVLDEGWPLELGWHGGFESSQTYYVLRNSDHQMMNRKGDAVHHGVLCMAYPEARRYTIGKLRMMLSDYKWDGVFICTRSQSRPALYGDQFGFNPPVVKEYERLHGVDIRTHDFDVEAWRRLHGEYLTLLLREIKAELTPRGLPLFVGIPRSKYLGPPVGNIYLDWRTWVQEHIVDALVIDQVAAVCPSTWLTMWPRDQGYGYVENHFQGVNRPPLIEDVEQNWAPVFREAGAGLYLARMWHDFDLEEHHRLTQIPGVSGLVFSSFRFDNREACVRGLWTV